MFTYGAVLPVEVQQGDNPPLSSLPLTCQQGDQGEHQGENNLQQLQQQGHQNKGVVTQQRLHPVMEFC